MSFVLDALKKLERQKQERTPTGDTAVVEGGRPFRTERRNAWIIWGSVVVALAALAVAAVALFQSLHPPSPETSPAAPAEASAVPAPLQATPVASAESSAEVTGSKAAAASPELTVPSTVPVESATVPTEASEGTEEPIAREEEEAAHPVRLVGRGGTDRASPAEEDLDPLDFEIPEGLPELVLQGTSVVNGRPVAVVNYQRLFEGDFIEGARVVQIAESVVELEYGGKRFKIKF